jgi:HD-GYP domain-containing protein (c-di-GMP phosphodiesterase class II)
MALRCRGSVHDIGKAFVAQEILSKDGPLSEVEWEIINATRLTVWP